MDKKKKVPKGQENKCVDGVGSEVCVYVEEDENIINDKISTIESKKLSTIEEDENIITDKISTIESKKLSKSEGYDTDRGARKHTGHNHNKKEIGIEDSYENFIFYWR